jgi:putative transposase
MRKEELLSDDFIKQFKTGEELYGFLAQLQKRGVEKMLEGALDAHLSYDKHDKSVKTNACNGFSSKRVKTSFGESEIQDQRDRNASFNLIILPKRQNMRYGLENVIVLLYAKAMSNSDIEEQIREVCIILMFLPALYLELQIVFQAILLLGKMVHYNRFV